jgi:ectoine hydroxylase-related dioxygenase (phytanoyl-CoA dioxygenase family)
MNASKANPIIKEATPVKVYLDSILPSNGARIVSRLAAKGIKYTSLLGIAFSFGDFTIESRATKVWPFSHLVGLKPDEAIKMGLSILAPVLIEAKGGDLLVFLSHLWHTVGSNNTANPRWSIFTFFSPWWMKPTWDYRDCGEEMFAKIFNRQNQLLELSPKYLRF